MSRISKVPFEQWHPELRRATGAEQLTQLEQGPLSIMAQTPEIAAALVGFGAAVVTRTELPRRLQELVRLRIAFHNQCRSCMAIRYRSAVDDGITENLVCSLEKPEEAPDLSDAEKAALRYADLSANDHFSIDDATFDGLRRHFSERQIVELGMFIAYCVGFGRLAATWNMVELLPESFRDAAEKHAPWKAQGVVVHG
jgi:AhpD family alkylhydroperoxidase